MRYQDLSPEQKAKFRDANRDRNVDDVDWWNGVYEDFIGFAELLGITTSIQHVAFSGFWSQGDGACFTGSWSPRLDASTEIRKHAPEDIELHRIADALVALGMKHKMLNQQVSASISRRAGIYMHSNMMDVELEVDGWPEDTAHVQTFRDLADWLYKSLEQEYTYLTSDESLNEALQDVEITNTEALT